MPWNDHGTITPSTFCKSNQSTTIYPSQLRNTFTWYGQWSQVSTGQAAPTNQGNSTTSTTTTQSKHFSQIQSEQHNEPQQIEFGSELKHNGTITPSTFFKSRQSTTIAPSQLRNTFTWYGQWSQAPPQHNRSTSIKSNQSSTTTRPKHLSK